MDCFMSRITISIKFIIIIVIGLCLNLINSLPCIVSVHNLNVKNKYSNRIRTFCVISLILHKQFVPDKGKLLSRVPIKFMVELFDQVYNLVLLGLEKMEGGGQSIVALKSALLEYQKEASTIEKHLQTCLTDHDILRKYCAQVVDENRRLLNLIKEKCENETGSQNLIKLEESLLVRNLQHQLSLIASERDTIKQMWLLSTKTVEDLQNELSHCKEDMENKTMFKQIEELKRDYSAAINLLEMKVVGVKEELAKQKGRNVELDYEVKRLHKEIDVMCDQINSSQSKLAAANEHNEQLKEKCFMLESKNVQLESLTEFPKPGTNKDIEDSTLQALKTDRNELQKALEQCHNTIEILSKQSLAGREKVEEAVKLVEEAMVGREDALARLGQTEEECRRLQIEIQRLIDQAGLQVSKELKVNEIQHLNEIMDLQMELKIAKQDNANKSVEVEQLRVECRRLDGLLNQQNRMVQEPTKLQKKLEKSYNNLRALEDTNFQILLENETLKKSFEYLQERHKNCKQEKELHRNRIYLLEKEIEKLSKELEKLDNVEIQTINLESSQQLRNRNDPILSRLQEIQDKNVATTKELQRHVEAHDEIARKWKNEMESLTDKFEEKLQKVKSDRKAERKKSKELKKMLTVSENLIGQQQRSSENSEVSRDIDNQK